MRQSGESAPRHRVARTFVVERLEDRRLLSLGGPGPSGPARPPDSPHGTVANIADGSGPWSPSPMSTPQAGHPAHDPGMGPYGDGRGPSGGTGPWHAPQGGFNPPDGPRNAQEPPVATGDRVLVLSVAVPSPVATSSAPAAASSSPTAAVALLTNQDVPAGRVARPSRGPSTSEAEGGNGSGAIAGDGAPLPLGAAIPPNLDQPVTVAGGVAVTIAVAAGREVTGQTVAVAGVPRVAMASPFVEVASAAPPGLIAAGPDPGSRPSPIGPTGRGPRAGGALPGAGGPSEVGRGSSEGVTTAGLGAFLRRADLLTRFAPIGGESLEQAIDRFLGRFDDLGAELSRFRGGTLGLFGELLAVSVALVATELVIGLLDRSQDDEKLLAGADGAAGFEAASGPFDPWSPQER
jgi:hypothetical protein